MSPRRPARRHQLWACALVLLGPALVACSQDEPSPAPSPEPSASLDAAGWLELARENLDAAQSLAFELTSADVPADGTAVVGGTGDLARPDGFRGDLEVLVAGSRVAVQVVSVGGTFYAQLPFTTSFSEVDPTSLGFTDPGTFMDPENGISSLLSQATGPVLGEEVRLAGEAVQEVGATLPGAVVEELLISADPATDVEATFAVTTDGGELRRAVLVGPFYAAGTPSTFTIELRDYGKPVDITPPL